MDWTEGYSAEVEYDAAFHVGQTPQYLNLVAALKGVTPVPLDQPFNYLELGFGRGLTLTVLAATHPQAQFYANDFNPSHVVTAQALAQQAGLKNLTLLDHSFAALAENSTLLPQFDFITLHGIYIWVNAENRRHIVDIIARHLKPGGILYISYNAMPGWASMLPLQRLLLSHFDQGQGRAAQRAFAAVSFAQQVQAANSVYLRLNPVANRMLNNLREASAAYLTHEFMHAHWQPLYHADVVKDLLPARVNFLGSTTLSRNFPDVYLSSAQQELMSAQADPVGRETLKDYFLNVDFREDVFVRGIQPLGAIRQDAWMSALGVARIVTTTEAPVNITLPGGTEHRFNPTMIEAIWQALVAAPSTVGELAQTAALQSLGFGPLVRTLMLLIGSQLIAPFTRLSARSLSGALQLNQAISADAPHGGDHQVLASGLLGVGIKISHLEKCVYDQLQKSAQQPPGQDSQEAADFLQRLQAMPGRLPPDAGVDEIASILQVQVPLWRQLGII